MTDADPRRTALSILNALDRGNSTLDRLLADKFDTPSLRISRRDIKLAYALVFGVLRWRKRLDWVIGRFSKQGIDKIDPRVLNILRIGVFQILHLDRIPESAAVNTSVEMAKKSAGPWVVRFVNGLLRNIARNKDRIELPDADADRLLWLSVYQSFPEWLLERWIDRFGFDQARELCEFMNNIAPLTLRTNTLKVSREDLIALLESSESRTVSATPHAPEGIRLDGSIGAVEELPGYPDGFFQVQDEAAQLVSHVLSPRQGESILDACAGLGGKALHIAQLMNDTGDVTAMDIDARKLEALSAEKKRLGLSCVSTRRHDLNQGLAPSSFPLYDRILVDAPCSGTGVIRRNPDTKWTADPNAFARYRQHQVRYLDAVSQRLKPGGILVYAVCSIAPEESDDVVSAFMKRHPEFSLDDLPEPVDRFGSLAAGQGLIRSLPHRHQMDGFFIARFKKAS